MRSLAKLVTGFATAGLLASGISFAQGTAPQPGQNQGTARQNQNQGTARQNQGTTGQPGTPGATGTDTRAVPDGGVPAPMGPVPGPVPGEIDRPGRGNDMNRIAPTPGRQQRPGTPAPGTPAPGRQDQTGVPNPGALPPGAAPPPAAAPGTPSR
jgi:hypothetical protein